MAGPYKLTVARKVALRLSSGKILSLGNTITIEESEIDDTVIKLLDLGYITSSPRIPVDNANLVKYRSNLRSDPFFPYIGTTDDLQERKLLEDRLQLQIAKERMRNNMRSEQVLFGSEDAGVDDERPVFASRYDLVMEELVLVNGADLPADGTNYTTLELINKGKDGTGTTVIATFDGSADAFTGFQAFVKKVADVRVKPGEVLSLKKTDTLTGQAVTNLLVAIKSRPMN